jgi:hypothetical protein
MNFLQRWKKTIDLGNDGGIDIIDVALWFIILVFFILMVFASIIFGFEVFTTATGSHSIEKLIQYVMPLTQA